MIKKRLLIFILVLALNLSGIFFWYKYSLLPVDDKDTTPVIFIVPKGQSVKEIAADLKKEDLVRSQIAFFVYVRLSGLAPKIQAGNYRLNKAMTASEIANELTHGKTDIWITIIEGWRVEETVSELAKNLDIPEREFLEFAKEGYMFPDTYLVPKTATAQEVVKMILDNFQKKVTPEITEKGRKQGLTLDEIIILASIVEREVKTDLDRAIVAGILLKRLRNNWPLQTDATIQYALGYQPKEKTWWKKNLTSDDLTIDSPFNTYKYLGLPPTPIASPGLSSINAVVQPKETDYWYYLSDEKGTVHYAETYEKHQQNIEKYLTYHSR